MSTFTGRVGSLSPEQEEALNQIKQKIDSYVAEVSSNSSSNNSNTSTSSSSIVKTSSSSKLKNSTSGEEKKSPRGSSSSLKNSSDSSGDTNRNFLNDTVKSLVLEDLQQLRSQDPGLLKFLRARDFNVPVAFNLLVDALKWKREFNDGKGIYSLDVKEFENELKSGKSFIHGFDKENRPILYVRVRLHNKNTSNQEEVKKFAVYTSEQSKALCIPPVEDTCTIFDMAGFSMSCMDYNFVQFFIHLLEKIYPESLGVCLILNAPMLFSACWAIIKGWLPPVTQKKILFVKTADLQKYVEPSQLLSEYGGENKFVYSYSPQ